jgi:hypothetical protein
MASAVAALQGIHANLPVEAEKIDVMWSANLQTVITNSDVDARAIYLPPCVPKQSRVLERSEQQNAVKITVTTMDKPYVLPDQTNPETAVVPKVPKKGKSAAVAGEKQTGSVGNGKASSSNDSPKGNVLRQKCFFLNPEFKAPKADDAADIATETAAVAGGNAEAASAEPVVKKQRWKWSDACDETMQPFWAVRRLTALQLKKEQDEIEAKCLVEGGTKQLLPRFNCTLEYVSVNNVCMITTPTTSNCMNVTRTIAIPFLTNSHPIKKGEELILKTEVKVVQKQDPNKKDVAGRYERASKSFSTVP